MLLATVRFIATLLIFGSTLSGVFAQQTEEPRRRSPQLTTDDVISGRAASATGTVIEDEIVSPETAKGGKWSRQTPRGLPMSLEVPNQTIKMEIPFPEELSRRLVEAKCYGYSNGKWLVMVAYLEGPTPADPRFVAEGMMAGMSSAAGVSDFDYSVRSAGNSRATIKGSYKRGDQPLTIDGFVVTRGNSAWLVLGQVPETDKDAAVIVRRVVNSVKIGS